MVDKTKIIIDNTTFASAGRAIYQSGRAAVRFYSQFREQKINEVINDDLNALFEFLTALVLFDVLYWDNSSYVQEEKDLNWGKKKNETWIYDWFNIFKKNKDIIQPKPDKASETLLDHCRRLALDYIRQKIKDGKLYLPKNFQVPLIYKSSNYVDRDKFLYLQKEDKERYKVPNKYLPHAMFLHRGLFYQSLIYDEEGISYLPHTYRACLMEEDTLKALSQIARLLPGTHLLGKSTEPRQGSKIMKNLDEIFFKSLNEALYIKEIPAGLAIGNAFYDEKTKNPMQAMEDALRFRNSKEGKELRMLFKKLVNLGLASKKEIITDRIASIQDELSERIRYHFPTTRRNDWKIRLLAQLSGPYEALLEGVVRIFIPQSWKERGIRWMNKSTHPTGFQLIFDRYIH